MLHELIQGKVVTLLSDPQNIVKQNHLPLCILWSSKGQWRSLVPHDHFFEQQTSSWQLRGAFFDSIIGVAAYVGWHSYAQTSPGTGHLIIEDLNFAMKFQH